MQLPENFESVEALETFMTRPSERLKRTMERLQGDLLLLGAGGKMGVTLAILAQRALAASGSGAKVICVSRFSDPRARQTLEQHGIEVVSADLMREGALEALPDAENILYLAGTKFGTSSQEATTWAINSFLPGLVARRYAKARIVAFSSGNVYPLSLVSEGGSQEKSPVGPIGEYAQSVLGRERIFEYFSRQNGTPMVLYRLNYAIDLRYGVLCDLAQKIVSGEKIDLSMGYVNIIWQGEANEIALRSLFHATSPPAVLNVTGAEILPLRSLANQLGDALGCKPRFTGTEAEDALISNATICKAKFGLPRVDVSQMISWTADWIKKDLPTLGKPTKFETRDGKF